MTVSGADEETAGPGANRNECKSTESRGTDGLQNSCPSRGAVAPTLGN